MEINWLCFLLGWLGGIPSGILGQWLFYKYLRWRKRKGEYLNTTMANGKIEFEGRVWSNISTVATMQEIVKQVLGIEAPPTKTKPRKGK